MISKKETYYIYHIEGVKIGCTKRLKLRMKEQGFTNWEILEIHSDKKIASTREMELQIQYGYRLDNNSYENGGYEWKGSKGGITNVHSGHLAKIRNLNNLWTGNQLGEYAVKIGILDKARKKANEVRRIKINVYKLNGDFIKSYNSIKEAAIELGIDNSSITKQLNGKLKRVGKYKFELQKEISLLNS